MTSRGGRERVARQIAMTVRRYLDIIFDTNAAERHEPFDRGAIEPRLVVSQHTVHPPAEYPYEYLLILAKRGAD